MFVFNPFGSSAYASDCWDEFQQEIAECDAMYSNDNPLTALFEALCVLADVVIYVFCEIGTMVSEM